MNDEDEAGPPASDGLESAPAAEAPAEAAGPRCGYCGSPDLRESRRGGLQETALRLAGCTLYRCEKCGRRFAFATLGHKARRHRSSRGASSARSDSGPAEPKLARSGRRRAIGVLATLVAALLTFLAAAWLISRSERARLDGDATLPR